MASDRPIHAEVLEAARRVADGRATFRLRDVVAALPHLNPGTVRTHVASRCCVNAPAHHQTRWRYFRALGRGLYRIEARAGRAPKRAARYRGWQNRIIGDPVAFGIDPTLIAANLRLTPTDRLERMRAFMKFVEDVRAANEPRLRASVPAAR